MVLSGSEGKSVLRLRAPADPRLAESIVLKVDGQRIYPDGGGSYAIPIQAKECSVEIAEKPHSLYPTLHAASIAPSAPATILVQSTAGAHDNAVLFCSGSGESVHLTPNRPVSVSAESGPFTFQLPRAPLTKTHMPAGAFTASYAEPDGTEVPVLRVPELETRISMCPQNDVLLPTFVATAEGFMIELVGDNGASVAGYGSAQLRLPDRKEHRVRITITDTTGRTFLRQSAIVPATEQPSLTFSIAEDVRGNPIITGTPHSQISVDSLPPVSGGIGVPLETNTRHVVVVREEGTSAAFEIGPRRASEAATAIHPVIDIPSGPEPWITQLAKALQSSDQDTARRGVQSIIPPNPDAASIVGFVSEQLFKTPPTISFTKSNDTVMDVQCAGYNMTASVDNAIPRTISRGESVQVSAGHNLTLSAVTPSRGLLAASCCMQCPMAEKNLDELLIARLLDTFQRHNLSPDKVASELANTTSPQSANGDRLLPLMVGCLRRLIDASQRPIRLVAGEAPEGTRLLIALDEQGAMELLPGSVMDVSNGRSSIRVSVRIASSLEKPLRNEFARALVDTYYRQSPPPLPIRWAGVPTSGPEEKALLELLLQMLRDHDNELARQHAQGIVSGQTDALQFACGVGCLQNIRTERPCRLSVDVDGTGFMQLEQGGQVPQGYAFPPGSTHRVHIIARDPVSGALCAETQLMLMGAEQADAPRQMASLASSCFLDANVSQVGEETHLRLVCPPRLRIVCDVDGSGGAGTGRSDYTAKMSAARQHNVNVQLLDDSGCVVFEQRLALPGIMAALWSVEIDRASIEVDKTTTFGGGNGGTIVTASLDRSPESDLTGPLPFNSNEPHTILLRKYFSKAGPWNACAGELSLRLPAFIDPQYVQEIIHMYRTARPDDGDKLRSQLGELQARTPSNAVKDLISALLDYNVAGFRPIRSSSSSDARIHFRISGDESSTVTH
ncbi:hypothetical protein DQ04_00361180 [Trypanosoma grayi]|uniref:hypothetical protein n=1 Tax=Trypanosoma grayi TaxID=71804 RepID=UPI0004F44298|nr:hypothetical protein DQ04_00361180 [Trypanosoma grayi]KEG14656.1 hypothetical protein DQ04_00361180 [Trypanosoma grayi]